MSCASASSATASCATASCATASSAPPSLSVLFSVFPQTSLASSSLLPPPPPPNVSVRQIKQKKKMFDPPYMNIFFLSSSKLDFFFLRSQWHSIRRAAWWLAEAATALSDYGRSTPISRQLDSNISAVGQQSLGGVSCLAHSSPHPSRSTSSRKTCGCSIARMQPHAAAYVKACVCADSATRVCADTATAVAV
jgi:hypothetical protein